MKSLALILLIGSLQIVYGAYSVSLLLKEFSNGQGFLADGTHCSDFWFSGTRCNIRLEIGIDFNSPNVNYYPCESNNTQYVDLGIVTNNSNDIVFEQQTYGAWKNPQVFNQNEGMYHGFSLCVRAYEATSGALIDEFTAAWIDAYRVDDFTYYSHQRFIVNTTAVLEPTMIGYAWMVTGDVEYPQVTRPPTTVPTTTALSGPIDCEDALAKGVIDESDSTAMIRIPGQTALVKVYCEVKGTTAQTIIQSRGEDPYSRTPFDKLKYADFEKYQGVPGKKSHFWLGLGNMNAFTTGRNQKYNMTIVACCNNSTDLMVRQFYSNISIGDAASGYVLRGVGTTVGLSVGPIKDFNKKFSTDDNYQGSPPRNLCAASKNVTNPQNNIGGWWFGACSNNLNGYYYPPGDPTFADKNQCLLDSTKASALDGNGIGVEINNGPLPTEFVSWRSYTRVRIGLYRADGNGIPSTNDFCN